MSKGQGKLIGLKFTEKLVGDVSGLTPNPVGGQAYTRILDAAITVSGTSDGNKANLIDDNTSTYWCTNTTGGWIQFLFESPTIKTGFRWYIGYANGYPTAFNITASNNGTDYVSLGTFTGTNTIGWQEYTFANETAYLYYKITVTAYVGANWIIYETQFRNAIGNEKAFVVTGHEYNYVPGGALATKNYIVSKVIPHPTEANSILLVFDEKEKFENLVGELTVTYDGGGNLMGLGGVVLAFSQSFLPSELIPKPDQNDVEHLEISNVSALCSLIKIYYSNCKNGDEHVAISGVTATGVLTHVNNL